jgi:hypothetical protein
VALLRSRHGDADATEAALHAVYERIVRVAHYRVVILPHARALAILAPTIAALRAHHAHAGVQVAGISLLGLCMAAVNHAEEVQAAVVTSGALDAATAAMRTHNMHGDVQSCGVELFAIAMDDAGGRGRADDEFVVHALGTAGAVEAVVSALRGHVEDADMQLRGYTALLRLLSSEDNLQRALRAGAMRLKIRMRNASAELVQRRKDVMDTLQRAAAAAADVAAAELLASEEAEQAAAAAAKGDVKKKKKKRGGSTAKASAASATADIAPPVALSPDAAAEEDSAAAAAAADPATAVADAVAGAGSGGGDASVLSAAAVRRRRRAAAKAARRRGGASGAHAAAEDDEPAGGEDEMAASGGDGEVMLPPPPAAVAEEADDEAPPAAAPAAAPPPPAAPAREREDDAELAATTCVVCMDAPRSSVLLPCRHLVLCGAPGCAAMLGAPPRCPLCRAVVTDTFAGVFLG